MTTESRLRGLSPDQFDLLFLSVGSHRARRPLSPVEVGRFCAIAKESGETTERIAAALQLAGPTMIGRFLKLLDLAPRTQHLVDWGESALSVVGFSTAFEIVLVPKELHGRIVSAVCEFGLTKAETRSVRQLIERSTRTPEDCVRDVVGRRAVVIVREVVVGSVDDLRVRKELGKMLQQERDDLLLQVLHELYTMDGEVTAKLGTSRFTVLGGESLRSMVAGDSAFEATVTRQLLNSTSAHEQESEVG